MREDPELPVIEITAEELIAWIDSLGRPPRSHLDPAPAPDGTHQTSTTPKPPAKDDGDAV